MVGFSRNASKIFDKALLRFKNWLNLTLGANFVQKIEEPPNLNLSQNPKNNLNSSLCAPASQANSARTIFDRNQPYISTGILQGP